MNYKIEGAINKTKKYAILYFVLWLFIVIVFVMPLTMGIVDAKVNGTFDINLFFEKGIQHFMDPLSNIKNVFKVSKLPTFFSVLWKYTAVFLFIMIWGMIKNAPKNEYDNIEHGSSDWCKNGEQYKILSDKKGIILAENNYLPVNKRGNVNVLVVGRFGFW